MDELKHVIKTNEAVLIPTENNKFKRAMKYFVWTIVGIIIIGSLIFQDNIFGGLPLTSKIILIVLVVSFGFYDGKKEYAPSPMELQFYDDHLVFYLPKRYYSRRVIRKQINILTYSTITSCIYGAQSKRIKIFGDGKTIWYNYRKDGSLPEKPSKEFSFTKGMIYFNTRLVTDIDFIKEIEENSPIKVTVDQS